MDKKLVINYPIASKFHNLYAPANQLLVMFGRLLVSNKFKYTTMNLALKIEYLAQGYRYLALRGGAQWLSGRVLDSRPKSRGLEPHQRHCVLVLEQDTFILA